MAPAGPWLGFDLSQLARRIAVKATTLQNWESDRSEPTPEKLAKLVGLLIEISADVARLRRVRPIPV